MDFVLLIGPHLSNIFEDGDGGRRIDVDLETETFGAGVAEVICDRYSETVGVVGSEHLLDEIGVEADDGACDNAELIVDELPIRRIVGQFPGPHDVSRSQLPRIGG